jgi:hypothetical protein
VSEAGAPPRRRDPARLLADVLVVLAAALLLGLVTGVLWPQLVDPVTVTRTEAGLVRDEVALAEQFDAEGWYSVLAALGGFLLGIVMLAWRRTDEVVTLLAVVAGALVASWLSAEVGSALGPADPARVLADAGEGATADAALSLTTDAVQWVWPLFAVMGALVYLVSPLSERAIEETLRPEGPGAAVARENHGPVDVSGAAEETPPPRP